MTAPRAPLPQDRSETDPAPSRMPAAYVRMGLVAGMLGYGFVVATDLLLGRFDAFELVALVGFVVALGVARRSPTRGGAIGLAVAVLETLSSFATYGIMTGSGIVLPVLVTVAGLFLGEVAALLAGAVSLSGALVAALWFGPARDGLTPDEITRVVVLTLTVVINTVITYAAVRSHRRALAASERAGRRYLNLFESAPDGVIALGADGRVVQANGPAERMFGHGSLQGRALSEVLVEAGARSNLSLLEGRPERPALVEVGTGRHARTIEVTASAAEEGVGLLVLRETTERHALEEQLRHAQRLETVGLLAGGVAHDFNNLLTAIGGNAQIVAEEGTPELRELALEIIDAQRRGSALTRQLLAFARRDARRPGSLDLAAAARGTERLLARILAERNRLVLVANAEAPVVADQAQVEQVIVNLVTNARDASPPGAAITVTVRVPGREEAARLGWPLPGDAALLEVSDHGAGMSPETRARIFEPFFTTKPRGQGTGLGLSTVHGIVAQSGGHVAVESEPGQGTTFRVFLPLAPGTAAEAAPESAPAPAQGAGERVLVVEDDPAVRSLVQRVLQGAGYAVVGAGSGPAALDAATSGARPSLLLTDMAMPGMTGPEVAGHARERWPGLPVVFMTGYFEADGAPAPYGVTLQKPFSPDELLHRVREALRGSAAQAQPP